MFQSSQRPSLNKNGLEFNKVRTPSKGSNQKKKNRLVYKCTHCKRFSNLEPFCFENFKSIKDNNLRPSGKTNAPGLKKIWLPSEIIMFYKCDFHLEALMLINDAMQSKRYILKYTISLQSKNVHVIP